MHPVICHIGPFTLYSYGLLLALGVLTSGWLTAVDAEKRLGIKREVVFDLVFWVVLSGIAGARIFYVLLNFEYFFLNPLEIGMIWRGGLAWQGSFLGGLIAFYIFHKRNSIPAWKFLDIAMPYVALGHAIGRVGCLFNGCCYGKPAAWGVLFPFCPVPLQPTQIYMSLGQILIFIILRSLQPRLVRDGQIFVWYLLLSSVERFVVEFFRDDHLLYFGFSLFQYICLVIFIAALLISVRLNRSGDRVSR